MTRANLLRASIGSVLVVLAMAVLTPGVASAATPKNGCAESADDGVRCASITVPENRSNPTSRSIDLAYSVVSANVQPATGTPIVLLSSTPGQSSERLAEKVSREWGFGNHRDVVVLGQRGGNASSPSLDCPGVTDSWFDAFTSTDESTAAEGTTVGIALESCISAFVEDGGDPSGYTIAQTASDIVDLRNALEYPSWTLFGSGWSSKVMSAVASLDSAGTDAVLLDSYSPADRDIKGESYAAFRISLDELSARSATAGTDYYGTVMQLAADLDDDPFSGPVTNPFTGRQAFVELEGNDFVSLVQYLLSDPSTTSTLPILFDRLSDGDSGAMAPFVTLGVDALGTVDWPRNLLSTCLDEKANWSADPVAAEVAVPKEGEQAVVPVDPPLLVNYTMADSACAQAGIAPASIELRVAPTFTQPTLILAGSGDPLTPAATAEAVGQTLPSSQFVSFAGAAHGVLVTSACAVKTAEAWLAEPVTLVGALCDHAEDQIAIVAASEVHETSRAASVVQGVQQFDWFVLLVPIIFLGFCALWFLGWIIALIVRGVQRERLGLLIASGIPPVTGLVFGAVAYFGMTAALQSEPALFLVGVPSYFPYLGILLVVGLFALIIVWRLGSRAAALLASAGVIVWLAMLAWFAWIILVPS